MPRKLTILLDEQVYERLHAVAGKRRVGRLIEQLVRDRLLYEDLDGAYASMAAVPKSFACARGRAGERHPEPRSRHRRRRWK